MYPSSASVQANRGCKIKQYFGISVRLVRVPLSFLSLMSNSGLGVSYAASYPCICWHYKGALYLVMGCIPGVLRTRIRMVLPQAIDIKAGSLCTRIWHNLVGYRKVTRSSMTLPGTFGKVFTGYFQPGFALKAAAEHWLSQIYTALSHLSV